MDKNETRTQAELGRIDKYMTAEQILEMLKETEGKKWAQSTTTHKKGQQSNT